MRCETCGADNSATNCYCGQCGKSLERSATNLSNDPRLVVGGGLPSDPIEASADLPPEVIDFDNQIPLIANNSSDRRHPPAPELVEQVHTRLDREAELHDQLRHESTPHFEVHTQQEAKGERMRQSEYLRWDSDDNAGAMAAPKATSKPNPAQSAARPSFMRNGERTTRTGVSGPSFLGLTDDPAPVYDEEEPKPKSHLRRNLALAILGVVSFLTAMQWTAIHDYALTYLQNGSIPEGLREKFVASASPVAADQSSHTPVQTSPIDEPGAAQAAESSRNDSRGLPVPSAASPQAAPATPSATSTRYPDAMGAPVSEVTMDVPEPSPARQFAAKSRTSKSETMKPETSAPRALVPGGEEMNRAARASDAEVRATWLWKAISKGNPEAPVELAKMYEQGNGVVRSCDQAQVLLRSAAAKGNEQAKLDLQQLRIRGGCSAR